jgi:hypothetical protein
MRGDWGATTSNRTSSAAFYAQEQWTVDRWTLQGGLRYERAWSWAPAQQVGPDLFIPNTIQIPRTNGVDAFNDITMRAAATWDVFGTGRTALKVNAGEYLEVAQNSGRYTATNPRNRIDTATNRNWSDTDGDFFPDCDLLNPRANGECSAWSDQGFGQDIFTTTFDPALISGWNVRPNDWQFGVGIQQEILPRVSAELSYNRRWFGNFQVTDDRSVSPSDYQEYSITAPSDPRLPGGGGGTIGDLYDLTPEAAFGRVRDNFITAASNFGDQIQYWHGVDFSVNSRMTNGLRLQGGFNVGRTVQDDCDVAPKIDNPSRRFCRLETPYLTQIKGLAAYTIPRVDVQVSATFQSKPYVGANNPTIQAQSLSANWVVASAQIAPSLGRALSGGAVTVVNLVQPGTLYGDRINQIDLRVSKLLRYGRTRTRLSVDLYNALNASTTESYQQTFGGSWLQPRSIMAARIVKLSAQLDF